MPGSILILLTVPLAPAVPGLNVVSLVPFVFSLIIRVLFDAEPEYEVKLPPNIILPSDWSAPAKTPTGLNPTPVFQEEPVSFVPSVFRRAIPSTVDPEYVPNCPPTIIFWSDCSNNIFAVELSPVPWFHVDPVSTDPFVFNRVM